MSVTAWLSPTVAVSGGGGQAWNNPQNVYGAGYAEAPDLSEENSASLLVSGFPFAAAVPAGAAIDGWEMELTRSQSPTDVPLADVSVRTLIAGVTSGDNKSNTHTPGTSWGASATVVYGGPTDKWGLSSADRDDIVHEGFGSAMQCVQNDAIDTDARIDSVRMRVYYTAVAAAASTEIIQYTQE